MGNSTVEILAPAGSYECLKAAICAGADAVYIGGSRFGARAYAQNLSEEDMLAAIDYVHLHGRKIYMTVNTLLKDSEMDELYDYLLPYYKQGLDAVIVQDVGVLEYVKEHFPLLPIHISTQMTVTGMRGAAFFKEQGAERVVPARELSLEEVRQMKDATGLEIECFVHGALCYCYSGQCLMSSMIGGRSGNRGQCAQPCRLPYRAAMHTTTDGGRSLTDGKKPQDILSLKDLCTIYMIPELMEAGIDSFKIEGRMKQPDYVYAVVSIYRKYVDLYEAKGKAGFQVSKEDKNRLLSVYRRRGYTEGYYKKHNGKDMISLKRPDDLNEKVFDIGELKLREKMRGKLILSEGRPAKIRLEADGISVSYEGAEVQTAQNQPLSADRIEKQMRKTGETPFEFEALDIEIHGNVFLPMQALNELRRESIAMLTGQILLKYHRNIETDESDSDEEKTIEYGNTYMAVDGEEKFSDAGAGFTVSVSEPEQLSEVLGDDRISVVYVDSQMGLDKKTADFLSDYRSKHPDTEEGQKIYLAMPHIFREKTIRWYEKQYERIASLYDGILVRNWETYVWLLDHGYEKPMIADYNLYIFNQKSKAFMEKTRLSGYTASVELNYRELKKLDISDGTLIVYGYQPVMITANCICKSTDGCSHQEGVTYLKDRYQKKFAVKNCCKCCYNIIYNSAPLLLAAQAEDVKALHALGLRLDFTLESAEEMKKILDLYEKVFLLEQNVKLPDMEYTNGHFKRGVK